MKRVRYYIFVGDKLISEHATEFSSESRSDIMMLRGGG
jgi:hypothetical protein